MSEEKRLMIENDLCMNKSKAQVMCTKNYKGDI